MHELALCAAVADIVRTRARGREVQLVRLRVGELRQVVPDTLSYCWTLVVESTALDGARLEIERVPARLRCSVCTSEHELGADIQFACPVCRSTDVSVVAGEELIVTSIDVAPQAAEATP